MSKQPKPKFTQVFKLAAVKNQVKKRPFGRRGR